MVGDTKFSFSDLNSAHLNLLELSVFKGNKKLILLCSVIVDIIVLFIFHPYFCEREREREMWRNTQNLHIISWCLFSFWKFKPRFTMCG